MRRIFRKRRSEDSGMFGAFQNIGFRCGNTADRIPFANQRNSAFVAVDALVVTDLQVQGTVAKVLTSKYAFRAADAQSFVNRVFIVGVLNESTDDGIRGAK